MFVTGLITGASVVIVALLVTDLQGPHRPLNCIQPIHPCAEPRQWLAWIDENEAKCVEIP